MMLSLSGVPDLGSRSTKTTLKPTQPSVVVKTASKGLVTERTLPIEGKGQNLVTAPNMLHIIMSSNSDWVVPASHDERRYAVFDAAANHIGDRKYFAEIAAQLDNGGLAAMIQDLLCFDISDFEVRDIPASKAL